MKIKTADLSGPALDYAAAIANGYECFISRDAFGPDEHEVSYSNGATGDWHYHGDWSPTTRWAQGGPIIERKKISLIPFQHPVDGPIQWTCTTGPYGSYIDEGLPLGLCGSTPLIAAMRCYVSSELGDKVDVPDELT